MQIFKKSAFILLSISTMQGAQAAPVPSTGDIANQITPQQSLPELPGQVIEIPEIKQRESQSNIQIPVKKIVLVGNTRFCTPQLRHMVSSVEGKTVTLSQLEAAANRVTQFYHDKGYPLAYAYIPAQSITDGLVIIGIIETRYDQIKLKNLTRLKNEQAMRALQLKSGDLIEQKSLNRQLLLLNRIPGVLVSSTLAPGSKPGTTSLLIQLKDQPMTQWKVYSEKGQSLVKSGDFRVQGVVFTDNAGSTYTGQGRMGVNTVFPNPFGYGSRISFNALHAYSGLLDSGGFNLESPNIKNGLTTGLYGSRTHYQLGGEFASLKQSGQADQLGLYLQYPYILQPGKLVNLRFDALHSAFEQNNDSVNTHDKSNINQLKLGLSFAYQFKSAKALSGSFNLSRGELKLETPQLQQADANGPKTQGDFWISELDLHYQQALPKHTQLQWVLKGQATTRNLNSSQKLFLGGPQGVMSTPIGEAGGDEGFFTRIRLQHPVKVQKLPGRLSASALLQTGKVWTNHTPYTGATAQQEVTRTGAGIGLNYQYKNHIDANLTFVHEIFAPKENDTAQIWANLNIYF